MNGQAVLLDEAVSALERRYSALLLAYPAEYRRTRGGEIVGTLLEAARPGQQWPRPAEAADIVLSGLRKRLRVDQVPGLVAGITTAAPIALAFAAGLSAFLLVAFELTPNRLVPDAVAELFVHHGLPVLPQRVPLELTQLTLGTVVYAGWLLAALVWSLGPRRAGRPAIALAMACTVAVVPASTVNVFGRPPLWTTAVLTALGLLALAGPGRPDARAGWAVGAAVPAVAAAALAYLFLLPASAFQSWYGYYDRAVVASGTAAATLLGAVAGIALVQALRHRPARHWLWAALLLALPGGCLGPVNVSSWLPRNDLLDFHYGRLANLLLTSCTLAGIMVWLAGTGSGARARRAIQTVGLVRTSGLVIGCGAGLATLRLVLDGGTIQAALVSGGGPVLHPGTGLVVVFACWLLASVGWVRLPRTRSGATASVALVAGALLASGSSLGSDVSNGMPISYSLVLTVLAAVALCGAVASAPDRSRESAVVLASGAGTFAVAATVAFYGSGYRLELMSTVNSATLLVTLVLVPLAAVTVAGTAALREPVSRRPLRRAATWAMVLASTAWVALVSLPYLLSFGPVLSLTIGAAAVAGTGYAMTSRRRAHDPALEQGYRQFATRAHPQLLAIGYLLTNDDRAAERLARDALARVYPVWHRLPEQAAADALARRALVRAAGRTRPSGADGSTDIWSRVRALPFRARAALVLSVDEALTPEEVADALGCSVASIERLAARSLAELQAADPPNADPPTADPPNADPPNAPI